MSGTINISRDLWHDEAFAPASFSEREAWIWMICEASWKTRKKRVGDYIIPLERGQLAASIRFMADAWGWHRNKVHRFLGRIEELGLIRAETGTGVNVVTICKYDEYQNKPKADGTGPGQVRDRSGTNYNKGEIRGKEISNDITSAFHAFRECAERTCWPVPKKLSTSRKKALGARLKELGGLESWRQALRRAEASTFLCQSTWFGLDWMLKPANLTKIVEGNYDSHPAQLSAINGGRNGAGTDAFDEIAYAARARGTSG